MKTIDLDRFLKDWYEQDLSEGPAEHPLKTKRCPPLPLFAKGIKDGWSEEYREHVPNCEYCQKTIAMWWRPPDHPGRYKLVQHALGILPDKEAMRIHLVEDQCEECQRTVANLSRLREAGATLFGEAVEGLRELANRVVIGSLTQAPAGVRFAGSNSIPFYQRWTSEDGTLIASLLEKTDGGLKLTVDSSDDGLQEHTISARILRGVEELWRGEAKLSKQGKFGVGAKWPVSAVSGELCLIVHLVNDRRA